MKIPSLLLSWPGAIVLAAAVLLLPDGLAQTASRTPEIKELRVLTWNIWHGGREDGVDAGPAKTANLLRDSGADLIALQETYGSGERLAESLGFHFHARGTNVSILSRYPVLENISVGEEFQNVGALIELPDGSKVAFYSIWLPYSGEIWAAGTRDTSDPSAMRAACEASAKSLAAMWPAIEARLADSHPEVPIYIAGDFNSMSSLDYGEVGVDQYGVAIDWATSKILPRAGFLDSYREANPVIHRVADSTWSPRFPRQSQDRIDFIYYSSPSWRTSSSTVIRDAPLGFPSDHAALLSTFAAVPPRQASPVPFPALTYNIKHGLGLDNKLDLGRAARVLDESSPAIIALQEVDLACERSGFQNQANALAAQLGMHPAFGSFMDFQGGQYGLATLSRYPVARVESVRLPDGNEPRVALVVEVQLPHGQRVLVVNVHFDWVADDGFRLAQARMVRDYLANAELPWVLMGDFNDVPDSATLELFREIGVEVKKRKGASATIPADEPTREIDFIFHSKSGSWTPTVARVLGEKIASDHRPVMATLSWKE